MVRRKINPEPGDPAAGNGILSRRVFLEGALLAGAAGASASDALAEPLIVQPWMKVPGAGFAGYGQPSQFESKVLRVSPPPPNPATQGVGATRTPLQCGGQSTVPERRGSSSTLAIVGRGPHAIHSRTHRGPRM